MAATQQPARMISDSTARLCAVGIQRWAKVCSKVITESTAPYRFRALWLITLSRNSTSINGPMAPVASFTASMVSMPTGVASTATEPNTKDRIEPSDEPR
ncbi:hypothetical protein D3C72_2059870 [compost metagenome]